MSIVGASSRPWIVLVGGFLGAGKTTLIFAAARELQRLGQRCAIIMNDQGTSLVDMHFAALQGLRSEEVTGGCFCCRLSNLVEVADSLRAYNPYVIFAEPVGSCADIVATVLRPFQEYHQLYRLAPFTVLVDPDRMRELQRDDADPHHKYLFDKQIEEADFVCFTKADLRKMPSQISGVTARQVSANTGSGVLAWLDEILSGTVVVAHADLEIDYQQYAQAEAALTWLNLHVVYRPLEPTSPLMVMGPFFDSFREQFAAQNLSIVHMKMLVSCPTGFVKAAVCATDEEPTVEGALNASPALEHDLLLNLRAVGPPPVVRQIVESELSRLDGQIGPVELNCFAPAAPQPEKRIRAGQ